jgi:hypothetical protein
MDAQGRVFWAKFDVLSIEFNSTGSYDAISGGNEYSMYSALARRLKTFGEARELVWGIGDVYAFLLGFAWRLKRFMDPVQYKSQTRSPPPNC